MTDTANAAPYPPDELPAWTTLWSLAWARRPEASSAQAILQRGIRRQRHGLRGHPAPVAGARQPPGGGPAAATPIPVTQVRERVRIEPNHVYVVPPNNRLFMADGHLGVAALNGLEERRAPVDIFFRTLAESRSARAPSAVVLSGTGADGSMGMKRIKERGGICIVQDPDEAEHDDMPRNAIATALVDDVLPVAAMPGPARSPIAAS